VDPPTLVAEELGVEVGRLLQIGDLQRHAEQARDVSHHERPAAAPSTMLKGQAVAITRSRRNPAFAKRPAKSFSVRSRPPVRTSMLMSSIFPQCGSLPGGITLSTTRILPFG